MAQSLGEELAKRGIKLVYGGGSVGLMGVLARAVNDNGGEVYGVIPKVKSDKLLPQIYVAIYLFIPMHKA